MHLICIDTCTYMSTYTYTCTYAYIYMFIYIYMYTCLNICIHVYIYIYVLHRCIHQIHHIHAYFLYINDDDWCPQISLFFLSLFSFSLPLFHNHTHNICPPPPTLSHTSICVRKNCRNSQKFSKAKSPHIK